jgi:predicted RND superfamily exporter protein
LTNKYQQEYVAHGNKARALQRVITKGTATLMTNLTTAAGFATLSLQSELLKEFGIISSLSILLPYSFYVLSSSHLLQLSTCSTRKAPETFESQLH